MRAQEFITELFGVQDTPKTWKWEYFDDNNVAATFTVGNKQYHFSAIQDEDEGPGDWDVEFKDPTAFSPYGITGAGRSSEVFSTVVSILKEFIAKKGNQIRCLMFSAKEGSRQELYAKMAKRLLSNWTLTQRDANFILTRPGLMWWVYSVEFPNVPAVKIKADSAEQAEKTALSTVQAFKDADPMGIIASSVNRAGDRV